MSRPHPFRLLAALLALAVALVWALPARSQAAPLNATAASAAADYIAGQLKADPSSGGSYVESADWFTGQLAPNVSYTAEAQLALVAAGGHATEVTATNAWLITQAATYATSSGAAAKLALAAVAAGSNPRSYGPTQLDLVARIIAVRADGSVTSWGDDAFSQSLAILGLVRSNAVVPAAVTGYLVSIQQADGSFGYHDYQTGAYVADPDSTAIALQALAAVAGSDPAAKAAAVKARDWLAAKRLAAGYWDTPNSPANTAGYAGTAMLLVSAAVPASVTWLTTQQRPDGGLPASLNGTTSDLYATIQGILLFAGESLLSVGPGGTDRVSLTVASSSAPGSASASGGTSGSASASSSASASVTASVSTPASGSSSASASAKPSTPASSVAASSLAPSAPASSGSPSASGVPVEPVTVALTRTVVPQGGTVTVTGTGFTSPVRGIVRSDPIDLGTLTPSASGTVTFTIETAALAPGTHTVTLTSAEATATASFTVTASTALAATGSEVPLPLVALAVVALIGGVGLVVAGRRRTR